jgi:hypothetical protein
MTSPVPHPPYNDEIAKHFPSAALSRPITEQADGSAT